MQQTGPDTRTGVQSSIEAHSQQARDLLRGGDIRIPGLGAQPNSSKMMGNSRDESFDLGSKSLFDQQNSLQNQFVNTKITNGLLFL